MANAITGDPLFEDVVGAAVAGAITGAILSGDPIGSPAAIAVGIGAAAVGNGINQAIRGRPFDPVDMASQAFFGGLTQGALNKLKASKILDKLRSRIANKLQPADPKTLFSGGGASGFLARHLRPTEAFKLATLALTGDPAGKAFLKAGALKAGKLVLATGGRSIGNLLGGSPSRGPGTAEDLGLTTRGGACTALVGCVQTTAFSITGKP